MSGPSRAAPSRVPQERRPGPVWCPPKGNAPTQVRREAAAAAAAAAAARIALHPGPSTRPASAGMKTPVSDGVASPFDTAAADRLLERFAALGRAEARCPAATQCADVAALSGRQQPLSERSRAARVRRVSPCWRTGRMRPSPMAMAVARVKPAKSGRRWRRRCDWPSGRSPWSAPWRISAAIGR